jgi:UDP-N-acetylmuramyl pentapeptide phosphotransferase/UDP-N-acetylglucosamine-1-phosphate transferase
VIAALAALLITLPLSVLAVRLVLGWLRRKQIMDLPNERSSHSLPTPRGGGLAVTPVCLLGWGVLLAFGATLPGTALALAAAAALLALSWLDDRHGLPPGRRFAVHIAACALGLAALPNDALIFQGVLPFWLDRLTALMGYVWFVNLFNFMDGIDGISGTQTACIALGLILLAFLTARGEAMAQPAVLLAAALGFLFWNWHPAKLFLGDSGSVPLGFLLGWLLLDQAAHGHLAAALILPLYYLADATITLVCRLLRREKVWQAHRQHFYQQALAGGRSHDKVVLVILLGNLVLIALALDSLLMPWPSLALAAVITGLMLRQLRRMAKA